MRRRWIPIQDLEYWDQMHFETDDGWDVDEERDGQTKQQHVDSINHFKGLIAEGAKILPILVMKRDISTICLADNVKTYVRLDGFKRVMAHIESGQKFIEAFVCSEEEYRDQKKVPYGDGELLCWKGGQFKEVFSSAVEGYEQEGAFDYADQKFLYKNDDLPHGLRIELSESIHVHWGEYGRYRLGLGRRDFEQLAEAISSIV